MRDAIGVQPVASRREYCAPLLLSDPQQLPKSLLKQMTKRMIHLHFTATTFDSSAKCDSNP